MFLTGFDVTTLNTLWADKNLKQHGLIQAFSRTNRILNSVKSFGNIVCFRDLKQATDDAIALFGDKDAGGIVLLKTYNDYYNGYDQNGEHKPGYVELIAELIRQIKELIDHFVESVNTSTKVTDDWKNSVQKQKENDLSTLITNEKLKNDETRRFIDIAFRNGILKTTGTDIDKLLPPVSRYGGGNYTVKKQSIIEKLLCFFEKYLGLV